MAKMKVVAGALLALCTTSFVSAQTGSVCDVFLTNPIVTKTTATQNVSSTEDLRKLQCSADWKSASDVQKAGISVDIPVYDMVLPLSANWDQSKVEKWKSTHCSKEERSASYQVSLKETLFRIDPVSADRAMDCIYATQSTAAVRCTITETEGGVLFQVNWRRNAGELASAAPKVSSLAISSAQCLNVSVLATGKAISEGGNTLLCTRGADAPIIAVGTNRGDCFAAGKPVLPAVVLTGTIEMDRPLSYSGQKIVLNSDLKIVTNGYPLRIDATRLEISGSPQIRSFEAAAPAPMFPGRTASTVTISAKSVIGSGLYILNVGGDGGAGTVGAKGPPGSQGSAGQSRTEQQENVCSNLGPFSVLCKLVPTGCTGGQDGGSGTPGGRGFDGYPGAPGGAGGNVDLILPTDALKPGIIDVAVNVGLDNKSRDCGGMICGGLGGMGGPPGEGGDGGPGGPGAPGSTYCGGTNSGPTGPKGPPGGTGPVGAEGARGRVRQI